MTSISGNISIIERIWQRVLLVLVCFITDRDGELI
jgi:hypothetical protein